jgi:hypothetical protein
MSEPEEKNTIVQNTPVSDSVVMVNRRLHSKVETISPRKKGEFEPVVMTTDRVTPAILGLLFLAGAGLMGTIAFGSLQVHFTDYSTENKEVAVAGFTTQGANITYEEYDRFVQEMREENYFMIIGGLGGLAALGLGASALLFLNRRHPAAHVGMAANVLVILQAWWAGSVAGDITVNYVPEIANTYFLLGVFHVLAAGCCFIFASSIVLTAAGRASLRPWGEPDMEVLASMLAPRRDESEE